MSNTRIVFKTVELTPEGILIRKMGVIDGDTGDELRIVNLTPELLEFIKITEIQTDKYFEVQAMQKKNPEIKNLINTFNLTT